MTYNEFKIKVYNIISKRLPPDTTVHLQRVYKNNGLVLDGLIFISANCAIAPTIYLNYYYENRDIFPSLDMICDDILRAYKNKKTPESVDMRNLTDYEAVRPRLALRLVNYEKNKELLQVLPHVRYLDLAVVFFCLLKLENERYATLLVHSFHMERWNVTVEELYRHALKTTPFLLPYSFCSIQSFLSDAFSRGGNIENIENIQIWPQNRGFMPMYVLSNSFQLYGAGCMLYPGLLERIAKKLDADLFLLPSSIHEIIVLPAKTHRQSLRLSQIVTNINHTELSEDEILSDRVYYYFREQKDLRICPYIFS